MELINRYITEVGRHLPEKSRPDLEREIRSLIEDMLEDRAQKAGRPIDDDLVVDVLKEFGSPEKVASAYLPEQYLIGPRLFPSFLTVIRIVLPIFVILAVLGFGLELGRAELPGDIPSLLAEGIAGILSSVIQALGMIVLIFAILERTVPELKSKTLREVFEKDWDPRKLPKSAPAPDKVNIVSLSVEIAFTVLGLMLFNFYPQIIAAGTTIDGEWRSVPVLAEIFFTRYLPWLTLIWGLEILLDIILISRGRWETVTTWFYLGVKAAMIVLALVMLAGPSLVGLTAESLVTIGMLEMPAAEVITNLLHQIVRWALIIAVIASLFDMVQTVWKQFFRKSEPALLVR